MPARLAVKVNSEIGRTEYLLVGLVETTDDGEAARRSPRIRWGRGRAASRRSAAPTVSPRSAGTRRSSRPGTIVDVQLLGRDLQLADLVVIGSHCVGLDYLLGELQQQGVRSKFLAVGSTAGLDAARRGECDVAGVHLLDPKTGEYNRPFLDAGARAVRRLRPAAGHRLPARRRALRRPHGARGDRGGGRRSGVRDGQPQPGQRHARADRSAARRRQARPATPCSRAITTPWPPPSCRAAPTGA